MRTTQTIKTVLAAAFAAATLSGCRNPPPAGDEYGGYQPVEGSEIDILNPEQISQGGDSWEQMPGDIPLPGENFQDKYARLTAEQTGEIPPVHFAYNAHNITGAELEKVRTAVEFLELNPQTVAVVEGHCDERGTSEYNVTLGEFRAQNVRERMISYGVSAARIQTASFGEEKPADGAHNESAWARNRRAEFAFYTTR